MEDRQSRLPEYVGKKIVEALKQGEEDSNILENNSREVEKTSFIKQMPQPQVSTIEHKIDFKTANNVPKSEIQNDEIDMSDLDLPDNVMMLVKLINQLPSGVNRQIGAQIIRQTIEAMGISMKSVLSEAQYIQEDISNSAQDCINTIEEYKNNILILEQKISTYKKQVSKLGELINLFVMTIK